MRWTRQKPMKKGLYRFRVDADCEGIGINITQFELDNPGVLPTGEWSDTPIEEPGEA